MNTIQYLLIFIAGINLITALRSKAKEKVMGLFLFLLALFVLWLSFEL